MKKNRFQIERAILASVAGIEGLDLLPSSLELVEIQDIIPDINTKAFVGHVDVLGNAIAKVKDKYDYIIIDCPPNLGAITLNGISISDFYVVPTVPDILSKIGISLIENRIANFAKKKHTCKIRPGGIVFTKIDRRTNLHSATMQELRASYKKQIFAAELPQRISIAEAPLDNKPFIASATAKGKSDWSDTLALLRAVTKEFIVRVA